MFGDGMQKNELPLIIVCVKTVPTLLFVHFPKLQVLHLFTFQPN